MATVELEIKAPDASPAQILGMVASLPSATMDAPRKIRASDDPGVKNKSLVTGAPRGAGGRLFIATRFGLNTILFSDTV